MALDQTANFIRGSTDASVDDTQTTISVVDASIFPDPASGEYNLVLWDADSNPRPDQDPSVEIVRVTARDTTNNDLTVTRGQEGTTGSSHPSGSALQLSPTAKMFGDIASRYVAEGENFDGQGTSSFTNLASVSAGELGITGLVDDGTNDDYLTKIEGANTFYWGNVDPSTVETVETGDLWADNSEAFN